MNIQGFDTLRCAKTSCDGTKHSNPQVAGRIFTPKPFCCVCVPYACYSLGSLVSRGWHTNFPWKPREPPTLAFPCALEISIWIKEFETIFSKPFNWRRQVRNKWSHKGSSYTWGYACWRAIWFVLKFCRMGVVALCWCGGASLATSSNRISFSCK